ncbi:hypothetical protein [Persephonella sp. KM09-Lau-8]|uniref:hypothetical protein n=1 Tax=Persephonella sp. KM09-Lau-8 TaxID=1158345 RepID=UPI000495DAEF|nr:hypothetical protein [Persephonella sp. KM09-Lau-8]
MIEIEIKTNKQNQEIKTEIDIKTNKNINKIELETELSKAVNSFYKTPAAIIYGEKPLNFKVSISGEKFKVSSNVFETLETGEVFALSGIIEGLREYLLEVEKKEAIPPISSVMPITKQIKTYGKKKAVMKMTYEFKGKESITVYLGEFGFRPSENATIYIEVTVGKPDIEGSTVSIAYTIKSFDKYFNRVQNKELYTFVKNLLEGVSQEVIEKAHIRLISNQKDIEQDRNMILDLQSKDFEIVFSDEFLSSIEDNPIKALSFVLTPLSVAIRKGILKEKDII